MDAIIEEGIETGDKGTKVADDPPPGATVAGHAGAAPADPHPQFEVPTGYPDSLKHVTSTQSPDSQVAP